MHAAFVLSQLSVFRVHSSMSQRNGPRGIPAPTRSCLAIRKVGTFDAGWKKHPFGQESPADSGSAVRAGLNNSSLAAARQFAFMASSVSVDVKIDAIAFAPVERALDWHGLARLALSNKVAYLLEVDVQMFPVNVLGSELEVAPHWQTSPARQHQYWHPGSVLRSACALVVKQNAVPDLRNGYRVLHPSVFFLQNARTVPSFPQPPFGGLLS